MLPHTRKKGVHYNERTMCFHWSPEIKYGGEITKKSAIYSLGYSIKKIII